ncbi:MAG: hypothetical protein AAGN15_26560, partial [Cyanobacteria bacterium J06581_3]
RVGVAIGVKEGLFEKPLLPQSLPQLGFQPELPLQPDVQGKIYLIPYPGLYPNFLPQTLPQSAFQTCLKASKNTQQVFLTPLKRQSPQSL